MIRNSPNRIMASVQCVEQKNWQNCGMKKKIKLKIEMKINANAFTEWEANRIGHYSTPSPARIGCLQLMNTHTHWLNERIETNSQIEMANISALQPV